MEELNRDTADNVEGMKKTVDGYKKRFRAMDDSEKTTRRLCETEKEQYISIGKLQSHLQDTENNITEEMNTVQKDLKGVVEDQQKIGEKLEQGQRAMEDRMEGVIQDNSEREETNREMMKYIRSENAERERKTEKSLDDLKALLMTALPHTSHQRPQKRGGTVPSPPRSPIEGEEARKEEQERKRRTEIERHPQDQDDNDYRTRFPALVGATRITRRR